MCNVYLSQLQPFKWPVKTRGSVSIKLQGYRLQTCLKTFVNLQLKVSMKMQSDITLKSKPV